MPLPKKANYISKPVELPDINGTEEDNPFVSLSSGDIEIEDLKETKEDESTESYLDNEERNLEKELHEESVPKFDDPFQPGSDTTELDDDRYIDKKKGKIKPFGGDKSNKSKKKTFAKSTDFDDRKNALTTIKVFRGFMIVVVLGVFCFGIKNTFFPAHVYTQEDISSIAKQAIGETGFPMNRGRALAEQYTKAYFEFNSENEQASNGLQDFYKGTNNPASQTIVRTGRNIQQVLTAPVTFSQNAVSETIANYSISVQLSGLNGKSVADDGTPNTKWLALSVTVFFDKKTNELSIAKDSPQVIPSYEIGDQSTQPEPAKIGTGDAVADLYNSMSPTVNGFLKAYAKSSSESHSELNQYVSSKPDPALLAGFNGKFKLGNNEAELDSSAIKVYPSTDSKSNNEWKLLLAVPWADTSSTDPKDTLSYTGKYVMTLSKSNDNKYYVTAFRPYIYTPVAPDAEK